MEKKKNRKRVLSVRKHSQMFANISFFCYCLINSQKLAYIDLSSLKGYLFESRTFFNLASLIFFFKVQFFSPPAANANLNLNLFQSANLQPTCWPRRLCRSSSQTAAKSPDSNPPTANFHLRGQFSKSRKIASRFSLTGDSLIFLPGCPPFIPPPKPPPP